LDNGPNARGPNDVRGYGANDYGEWVVAETFSLDHDCGTGLPKVARSDHDDHAAALHLSSTPAYRVSSHSSVTSRSRCVARIAISMTIASRTRGWRKSGTQC